MSDNNLVYADFFIDPWNPTHEELTKWAYGHYYEPDQDFELSVVMIIDTDPDFILAFAADPACPNRDWFLGTFYTWIGDTVKGMYSVAIAERVLQNATNISDERLQKFVKRSRALITDPSLYTYEKWGMGTSYIYGKDKNS